MVQTSVFAAREFVSLGCSKLTIRRPSRWRFLIPKVVTTSNFLSMLTGTGLRFPAGTGNFSLHHLVQNDSGAHRASYQMGSRASFPGDKAVGAWSWSLTSTYCRGQIVRGAIPPLPNSPSWRGAYYKKAQGQLLLYFTLHYFNFTLSSPLTSISPLHGAFSGFGWEKWPPDMEGRCE
jgi:hypothetical protein